MRVENLLNLMQNLKNDRYKGALIFGKADSGKSEYLENFVRNNPKLKILIMDIQKIVEGKPDHNFIFDLINIENFINWARKEVGEKNLRNNDMIIFDNFDFIVNLWEDDDVGEFIDTVLRLDKSKYPQPILFVLQAVPKIMEKYNNQNGKKPKIIKYNTLRSL